MKNTKWIFIVLAILILAGICIYFFFSSNSHQNPIAGTKMSTNIQNSNDTDQSGNNQTITNESIGVTEGMEKEVAKFSTKIMEEDKSF